jgi:hypothetical protein
MQGRLLARIRADVRRCGQSVVFVGADADGGKDAFYYTVGRGARGLPELLIAAPLRPEAGQHVLNELDRRMPEALPSGALVDLGGQFPVMVLDASDPRAKAEYTRAATAFHGDDDRYRVQQVLMCDTEGRFPPDCAPPYARQPLLGTMPSVH